MVTLRGVRIATAAFPDLGTTPIARRHVPPKAKATAASGTAAGRTLVIVESPAKAKTIQGYLGPGYEVEASVGHIRDLPKRAADIPAKYKGESWSRLGVDVEGPYKPDHYRY